MSFIPLPLVRLSTIAFSVLAILAGTAALPASLLAAPPATPVATNAPPTRWPHRPAPDLAPCFAGHDAALVVKHLASGKCLEWGGDRTALRLPPCSTFKIPHALIGLESGILTGPEQRFAWDGGRRLIKDWERDHSLRSSMYYSVVPIYKWLASQIGRPRMQTWLDRFAYGNRDLSSGLTSFWLGESLEISAREQIAFLQRLVEKDLPVASATAAVVSEITCLERFADGEYHGKTGSGSGKRHGAIGWWVGWLTRGSDRYVFACNIKGARSVSGVVARQCLERALRSLGLLSVTRAERLDSDFQSFDQNMIGGWRAVADGGCEIEAAKLLEAYLDAHRETLEPWQRRILHFHAGQMHAFAGETTAALSHFRQSYDPPEHDRQAPLRWNAYVRATIAFLQNDRSTLDECRDAMMRGPHDPMWFAPNRAVVDRLIAGFGCQTYKQAYCSPDSREASH